ncbi:very short patch repair endonuclease [Afifella sp. H1R]|uniref:very short patch repair endonuclease n=1 Tax=Afifella sp. H1R TaxID=2908841 RepID=UPI001F394BEC|nr:very short patch repair endonuclease [Afifella sp. H1R]MCF1504007.1 very short patch repair endonuclease [Afifella sp. H1R]
MLKEEADALPEEKARSRKVRNRLPKLQPGGDGTRQHRGDIMSAETRSAVMSRIKGRDTGPERAVASILLDLGLTPELQVRDLPGRPDFVFREQRVAIFVDGDFWHGWHFPRWRLKLSEKWEKKIEATRRRDARNHARLRRSGWRVLRIWEHQIEETPERVRERILKCLDEQRHEK